MEDAVYHSEKTSHVDDVEAPTTWTQTLAIERGGIQRVTDEQRQENTTKFWNACTFWYAVYIQRNL